VCIGYQLFIDVTIHYNIFSVPALLSSDVTKKGKAIPLQVWTGPEVSRNLRLPDFKTIGTWRW